jgi:hypothetical protein
MATTGLMGWAVDNNARCEKCGEPWGIHDLEWPAWCPVCRTWTRFIPIESEVVEVKKDKELNRFIKNLKSLLKGQSVLSRLEEAYDMAKERKDYVAMMDIALQIEESEND